MSYTWTRPSVLNLDPGVEAAVEMDGIVVVASLKPAGRCADCDPASDSRARFADPSECENSERYDHYDASITYHIEFCDRQVGPANMTYSEAVERVHTGLGFPRMAAEAAVLLAQVAVQDEL